MLTVITERICQASDILKLELLLCIYERLLTGFDIMVFKVESCISGYIFDLIQSLLSNPAIKFIVNFHTSRHFALMRVSPSGLLLNLIVPNFPQRLS